ncbi:helix-turn-helix domain-containing protein [Oceanobacillus sp. J11TS1]|uniref:helix-turn-helix domain-containing protein n=1 Tax=Oceanobacillus sp. J11TS1 TaxID=2807191 RepID=UPI001B1FCF95|nr:helix-turn-helix transcriptional regulator [Oceanobacillus sp. J11TS1]GIO23927.1 transcriptional regulator [Oceanobacillus sp. J11TS1]
MDGKRLRELRKAKKLTQAELGKIINVTKVSISGYESGDRTPDTDNLRRLADYFGVTSDYLLGRTNDPDLTAVDEKDIAKRIAKMRKDLEEGTGEDGLNFMGEPMSEDAKESLLEALEYAERQATRINKKYAPNKYKNRENQ